MGIPVCYLSETGKKPPSRSIGSLLIFYATFICILYVCLAKESMRKHMGKEKHY